MASNLSLSKTSASIGAEGGTITFTVNDPDSEGWKLSVTNSAAGASLSQTSGTGTTENIVLTVPANSNGSTYQVYLKAAGSSESQADAKTSWTNIAQTYAWLAYPDPDCFEVVVKIKYSSGRTGYRRYKMRPHPSLNCAYCYYGLTEQLGAGKSSVPFAGGLVLNGMTYDENREYTLDNVVWASYLENPFAFPATRQQIFSEKIVGMAMATKPFSEGQFGSYPLYVFTTGGIWAIPQGLDGEFGSPAAVSRDVALSREAIAPLDQSIAFATAKGIKIVAGSEFVDISPDMDGRHYKPDGELMALLESQEGLSLLRPAWYTDEPFLSFISNCQIAYDYLGGRIILFRRGYSYMYVYMLASRTWHKLSLVDMRVETRRALNSFPDCYIACYDKESWGPRLLNLSVPYDGTEAQPTRPGLIITRPVDLDLPDIYKTINRIRLRGRFTRGNVKYVLQGSNDGDRWYLLHSLRGPSWKMYRVILIVDLKPSERLSYLEIDYADRFRNRIR